MNSSPAAPSPPYFYPNTKGLSGRPRFWLLREKSSFFLRPPFPRSGNDPAMIFTFFSSFLFSCFGGRRRFSGKSSFFPISPFRRTGHRLPFDANQVLMQKTDPSPPLPLFPWIRPLGDFFLYWNEPPSRLSRDFHDPQYPQLTRFFSGYLDLIFPPPRFPIRERFSRCGDAFSP